MSASRHCGIPAYWDVRGFPFKDHDEPLRNCEQHAWEARDDEPA